MSEGPADRTPNDSVSTPSGFVAVPAGSPDPVRRRRGLLRRVVQLLTVCGVLGGTLVGVGLTTSSAHALDVGNSFECAVGGSEAANRGPELPDSGVTALIPQAREDLPPGLTRQAPESDFTLWEVMGPRGLRWSYTPEAMKDGWDPNNPGEGTENECSLMDAAGSYVAQLIWEAGRFVGGYTLFIKQYASADAPFASLYDARDSLIQRLRDGLFVPAIVVAIMVTGFWVATRLSRRRNARETYAGVITAAVLVILIVAVLSGGNYQAVTGAVDKYSGQFNAAAMNTVVAENPRLNSPCYLPEKSFGGEKENVTHNRGKRMSSCMLYEALLFNPWQNGQFGSNDPVTSADLTFDKDYCGRVDTEKAANSTYRCKKEDRPKGSNDKPVRVNLAAQQVIAQGFTSNDIDWAKPSEQGKQSEAVKRHQSLWDGVQYATRRDHESKYDLWRGTEPTGRMATAVSAIVVNVIALIFVGAIGLLTIFWHGVLFIGWILLPITGAFAVYPPARRLLRSHVGVMVQAVFLRNVFGLLLAVMIGILNALQINQGDTALKIFLMIIAAVALWKILSAIRAGALSPHVDEADGGPAPSAVITDQRPMRMASGAGVGVVAGAAAARGRRPQAGRVARYVDMAGGAARGAAGGAVSGAQGGTVGQSAKTAAAAGSGGGRSRRFFGRQGPGGNDGQGGGSGGQGGDATGRRGSPAGASPVGAAGRRVEVDPPAGGSGGQGTSGRGGGNAGRGADRRGRDGDQRGRDGDQRGRDGGSDETPSRRRPPQGATFRNPPPYKRPPSADE